MTALIDTSENLIDPDFLNSLIIVHRTAFVNERGENVVSCREVKTIGCVQPASGDILNRLPESLRVAEVMSFWVKGAIIADAKCQYPDLIIYNGNEYEVQIIKPWTNFGAGWSEATCVRKKISL